MAASLDCSGAFDNVTFDSSKRALTRHRLPPGITSWYIHLLENRRVTSDLYGSARTISPTMGTPQGGVLSPTIWNLIIDEIITEVDGLGCKIVGYADDLIILANGTHLPTIRDQLQIALNKIIQWGDRNNLAFNPQKSQVLLSTRKYKYTLPDKLSIKGTPIEFSSSIKYLGLLIEKSLSWHSHLKKQCMGGAADSCARM